MDTHPCSSFPENRTANGELVMITKCGSITPAIDPTRCLTLASVMLLSNFTLIVCMSFVYALSVSLLISPPILSTGPRTGEKVDVGRRICSLLFGASSRSSIFRGAFSFGVSGSINANLWQRCLGHVSCQRLQLIKSGLVGRLAVYFKSVFWLQND